MAVPSADAPRVDAKLSGAQPHDDIITAAKHALAEGEAIVARARTLFGLSGRDRPGPLQRAYARRWREQMAAKAAQPEPPPEPEPPDYHLSAADGDNVIAVTTMLALARAARNYGTRKAIYRDVGIHLQRLRADRDQAEWAAIVTRECALSKRRAYELMAIARAQSRSIDCAPKPPPASKNISVKSSAARRTSRRIRPKTRLWTAAAPADADAETEDKSTAEKGNAQWPSLTLTPRRARKRATRSSRCCAGSAASRSASWTISKPTNCCWHSAIGVAPCSSAPTPKAGRRYGSKSIPKIGRARIARSKSTRTGRCDKA